MLDFYNESSVLFQVLVVDKPIVVYKICSLSGEEVVS